MVLLLLMLVAKRLCKQSQVYSSKNDIQEIARSCNDLHYMQMMVTFWHF